jgi:hypothetical protein
MSNLELELGARTTISLNVGMLECLNVRMGKTEIV